MLAQQITAEVSAREWPEDDLFTLMRGAYPYRNLKREEFDECVRMLAEGFSTRRGRRGALLHHDAVNKMLRPRKGARLTAITSGGAIPDNADYRVMLEPESLVVGSVNEDFAVESLQGDIFQLGNTSYRILRVERGTVRVEDAHGQPPSIPFWLGEAPGRSMELSAAVSDLRKQIEERLGSEPPAALRWLQETVGLDEAAAFADRAVLERRQGSARHLADTRHRSIRALLRRVRRHAAHHSFAVRQPRQPGMGTVAAQALLPDLQFRIAGGGHRRSHRVVADACA